MSDERNRWTMHIKELREVYGVGLPEAERIALADEKWRRWVEIQINTDQGCRRMALYHIRNRGPAALIERHADKLKVR